MLVNNGVKQVCILSTHNNLTTYRARKTTCSSNKGQLDDLDYADDILLLFHTIIKIKKVEVCNRKPKKWILKINQNKTALPKRSEF